MVVSETAPVSKRRRMNAWPVGYSRCVEVVEVMYHGLDITIRPRGLLECTKYSPLIL
jgi:hypothetical protein